MTKFLSFAKVDKRRSKKGKLLQRSFIASMLIKLFFGTVEVLAGLLLLFVTYQDIQQVVAVVNTWSVFGMRINLDTTLIANGRIFVALYAILHGLPKIVLAVVLLKRKLWGYPLSLGILACFVTYQLYQVITTQSPFMMALTVFDVFVAYLILHEWSHDKRQLGMTVARPQAAKSGL
jgi:uncharacterized membrane protein